MSDWWAAAGDFYADLDDGGAIGAGHPRHYRRLPDDVRPIKAEVAKRTIEMALTVKVIIEEPELVERERIFEDLLERIGA